MRREASFLIEHHVMGWKLVHGVLHQDVVSFIECPYSYGSETKMIETKQKNLGGNAEAKADASAGRGLFA